MGRGCGVVEPQPLRPISLTHSYKILSTLHTNKSLKFVYPARCEPYTYIRIESVGERKDIAMICENITIGANGHLHFAGQDTVALAKQYGTPLYLLDEDYIRHQCRVYQNAFKKHFGPTSRPDRKSVV